MEERRGQGRRGEESREEDRGGEGRRAEENRGVQGRGEERGVEERREEGRGENTLSLLPCPSSPLPFMRLLREVTLAYSHSL